MKMRYTGFCICGHVYANEAIGFPHDHGSSWAVYGQASGETEMTDWEILKINLMKNYLR